MNVPLPTPVVIAAAPTGAHKSPDQFPSLPISADSIAEQAANCMAAGASMLHLHVRDKHGRHSLDADLYQRAVAAVRERCGNGLLIQLTSEQAGVYDTPTQIHAIQSMDTDFVSIALSEIIGAGDGNDLARAERLFAELDTRHVAVQLILYAPEQLHELRRLQAAGIIPNRRLPLLFVLGRYHTQQQSTPEDLLPFLEAPIEHDPWMVCAFGIREQACMRFAADRGGHLRLGFENNTLLPDGGPLESTAESIALIAHTLRTDGRTLAKAAMARRLLLEHDSATTQPVDSSAGSDPA